MDQTTTCMEPEVCETSFDCKEGRQCAGLSCQTFGGCGSDLFEPNDAMGEATDLVTAGRVDSRAEATLCRGDVDRFTFETTEFVNPAVTGALVVQVDIPQRDTGLGEVDVALMRDGTELDSARSGPMGREARLSVQTPITVNNHGAYTVVIRAGEEMRAAGVTYAVSANVVPQNTQDACNGAQRLRANQSLSGDTVDGTSSSIGSQCTSSTNESNEVIYRVEVDSPQQMTFQLTPQTSGSNLSMSLRDACVQPSSERACVDGAETGESETMTALLNEGTYYLVVQAAAGGSGGPFEVLATTTLKACTAQDDYCVGTDTARRCTPGGGRFQEVECDEGCNPSTGGCYSPAGDGCQDATSITPSMTDTEGVYSQQIQLRQLDDNHGIDFGGCLGSDAPRTTGPDRVYEVTIPAQRGFTAEVDFANDAEGALYVSQSCPDISGSCQSGAAQSTERAGFERLTVSNRTDQSVTRYLVIDTRGDQLLGSASFELTYKDVICTPGMRQCGGDTVEECNATGTGYEAFQQCGYACGNGVCQAETCMSAPTIPNDGTEHTYLMDLSKFANNYNLIGSSSTCLDNFAATPGREAVFQFQGNAGEVVDLEWDPLSNAVVYVVSDCTDLTGSCIAGTESMYSGSGSKAVSSTFSLDQGGTYYVMADTRGGGTSYGSSTLRARLVEPSCQPKTAACSSGGDFKYCNVYEIYDTYSCTNCCSTLGTGSSSPTLTIPDDDTQGVSDSLTVSGCSGSVDRLYVDVEVTHPLALELELELSGPDGTSVTLQDNDISYQDDIDELYPETRVPTDSLAAFQGIDPDGTWTLEAVDTQPNNTGTLDRWAIYAACN
jgi:subtilisin-like proprotein convertase family protein